MEEGARLDPVLCAAMADRVRRELGDCGLCRLEGPLAAEEFEAVARALGAIELRTDIKVDPDLDAQQANGRLPEAVTRPSVYQTKALEYHTDRPMIDVLAWYCVEQDDVGGASLLIDTADIGAWFSSDELRALGRIDVHYFLRDLEGRETRHVEPLVAPTGNRWAVFYVPWQVELPADAFSAGLFARFENYVKEKAERHVMSVRLERGQCLFIANCRMLHGRGQLPRNSRRHLIRLYIRSQGDAAAFGRTGER